MLVVGQTLVILTDDVVKEREITVNGYAFPNIQDDVLAKVLPFLTYLSIFSYHVNYNGSLKIINDEDLINTAKENNVTPIMVITNIGNEGRFDSDLAHEVLTNPEVQNKVITNILNIITSKGYGGLNIDFEYVYPEDRKAFIEFISKIKTELNNELPLFVALAPKTSSDQPGLLYEAHDYKMIGQLADYVILMTYEWGYSRGPARAVAPVNLVERVVAYAVSEIPSNKILMGIPNYGYDWLLPFKEGNIARSVGNYEAVLLAISSNQSINYDEEAQAPFFNYYDPLGIRHEVWFEDARSIQTKLNLVLKYDLEGISYWTINRIFPQNYFVLNSMFDIKKER